MGSLNKKMLFAPVLAVALVLSIAAAVSYLPDQTKEASTTNSLLPQSFPEPEPTSTPNIYFNVPSSANNESSSGSYSYNTQPPTPSTTTLPPAATYPPATTSYPTAKPLAASSTSINPFPFIAAAAAVILGLIAALTLFSEKNLKKELEAI